MDTDLIASEEGLEPLPDTGRGYPRFLPHPPVKALLFGHLLGIVKAYVDDTNFKTPTPIYVFKCPKGVWVLDYKHGFSPKQYMQCPRMLDRSDCPCH